MHSIARGSSRLAYLFISINLVLLLAFLVYASMTIRDVDASRDRYEGVIRNWHELRLAVSERGRPMTPPAEYVTFSGDMEALLSSELIRVAGRLSDPLAASEAQLSSAWDRLQLVFEREVFASTQASSSAAPSFDYSASVFEEALFGLEDVLTEFVALQQRALSILLYFLGGTILATTLVFVLVERENERERRAARQVRSLAWTTIRTQEQERARISRGLHDSLAQELSTTLLELDELARDGSPAAAERARKRLRNAIDWVRDLAHELHPSEMEQIGLGGALAGYCRELACRAVPSIEWYINEGIPPLTRRVSISVYRIAQEAITNAVRHGRAGRIEVRLEADDVSLRLTVSDDGIGMSTRPGSENGRCCGIGIVGMRERARMLGARFRIQGEPDRGTVVQLTVPRSTPGDRADRTRRRGASC